MQIMPHDWAGYVMLVIYLAVLVYVGRLLVFWIIRHLKKRREPEVRIIVRPNFDLAASAFLSINERLAMTKKTARERQIDLVFEELNDTSNRLQADISRIAAAKLLDQIKAEEDPRAISTREHLINTITGVLWEVKLQPNQHSSIVRNHAKRLLAQIEEEQAKIKEATIPAPEVPGFPRKPKSKESNLVAHARREMEIIGEDDWTKDGILKCVQAFADMRHTGDSASVVIPMLKELLSYRPLSPLTDNPEEWNYMGEDVWGRSGGVWQNLRDSSAFSDNGGKTYYYLRENEPITNLHVMYDSTKVSDA